ncbi:glycine cleavage system protein H [Horticoccus sp. 23ND18S-11]|uniref:glycine cleavage system protein H n=1 Tax=Horticoccus sp. 23ND18S-11 TaxID=3391832 RepID=UPI0039C9358A
MEDATPKTIFFKRSNFATHLPADALYAPSHFWLAPEPDGMWRVGFSKFAVRMLGDLVDQAFDVPPGTPIKPGTILGWIEGFKAISDIYGVIDGEFHEGNPGLKGHLEQIHDAPYGAGWLYRARGTPDPACMPARDYAMLLNETIDRMLQQQKDSGPPPPP